MNKSELQLFGFFRSAVSIFLLRKLPFDCFNFSRWKAVAGICLIGVLVGFDPNMRILSPEMPPLSLWLVIPMVVVSVWVVFLISLGVLWWWMKRGARWDGQGDLFNLVAASWLVADTIGAVLIAVGVPLLLTLPLWLYSVLVAGNALSGAIPKASLGYAIAGIVISLIPAMIVLVLLMGIAGFALAALGVAPGAVAG